MGGTLPGQLPVQVRLKVTKNRSSSVSITIVTFLLLTKITTTVFVDLSDLMAANGNTDLLKFVLDRIELASNRKLLVNGLNENLSSPLHWAVLNRHSSIVELLLSEGSNPNEKNLENETPLDIALKYEIYDIAVI